MSARDDLAAAMEAWEKATGSDSRAWSEFHRACTTLFVNGGGKHLLALLDAEPVAGPAGCVCWQSSEWLIPPEKILPACDSFHKGKDGLCGVCDHAEACHARPEASHE